MEIYFEGISVIWDILYKMAQPEWCVVLNSTMPLLPTRVIQSWYNGYDLYCTISTESEYKPQVQP